MGLPILLLLLVPEKIALECSLIFGLDGVKERLLVLEAVHFQCTTTAKRPQASQMLQTLNTCARATVVAGCQTISTMVLQVATAQAIRLNLASAPCLQDHGRFVQAMMLLRKAVVLPLNMLFWPPIPTVALSRLPCQVVSGITRATALIQ